MSSIVYPRGKHCQDTPQVNVDYYLAEMDIFEVRRLILLTLLDDEVRWGPKRGRQARFAEATGLRASYVSRMLNEPDAVGHKRIESDMAQRLEERLGLPDGTLLNPQVKSRTEHKPSPSKEGASGNAQESTTSAVVTRATITQSRPLLSWGRVNLMLSTPDQLQGQPGVTFVYSPGNESAGPNVKLVDMPDDSLAPRIRKGDRLAFDPDLRKHAMAGQVVLVLDRVGAYHIRLLKNGRAGIWYAAPLNETAFEPLESARDGLKVIAVAIARHESLIDGIM